MAPTLARIPTFGATAGIEEIVYVRIVRFAFLLEKTHVEIKWYGTALLAVCYDAR